MMLTRLTYCLLSVILLSGCTHFKAITARDNTAAGQSSKKSNSKKARFSDMSVSRGEVVTSSHNMSVSMPSLEERKKERNEYNANIPASLNALDIEKADWLQLKYAIVLDATVEKLTNVNLLKSIDEWWGTSYCMGGSTKNCIDCSAFTQIVMQNVYNISIPRNAQQQYKSASQINLEDLNEGDLVFFNTNGGRDITHVGIYIFNNKFVHAATSSGVMVSDLNDLYWKPRYRAAGRYINSSPATATYKAEEGK